MYEQLKRDIAEFKLVPGDRFTENELCERLEVSRTPVRQALFRLQQEGYVEVLFRSGWRVPPFDFEQFEQLYDLRMVLETTAVQRLCAGGDRIDSALLAELAAIWLVPVAERCADGVQVAAWDEQFHTSPLQTTTCLGGTCPGHRRPMALARPRRTADPGRLTPSLWETPHAPEDHACIECAFREEPAHRRLVGRSTPRDAHAATA